MFQLLGHLFNKCSNISLKYLHIYKKLTESDNVSKITIHCTKYTNNAKIHSKYSKRNEKFRKSYKTEIYYISNIHNSYFICFIHFVYFIYFVYFVYCVPFYIYIYIYIYTRTRVGPFHRTYEHPSWTPRLEAQVGHPDWTTDTKLGH